MRELFFPVANLHSSLARLIWLTHRPSRYFLSYLVSRAATISSHVCFFTASLRGRTKSNFVCHSPPQISSPHATVLSSPRLDNLKNSTLRSKGLYCSNFPDSVSGRPLCEFRHKHQGGDNSKIECKLGDMTGNSRISFRFL